MNPTRILSIAGAAVALTLVACDNPTDSTDTPESAQRRYGAAQAVGNGRVRSYVVLDKNNPQIPLEIGVALSESAMEGLPAPMAMNHADMAANAHANMTVFLLDLPSQNPTPYKFVQFDWNPAGHEPAGIYDLPHFDFHFYTVPVDVRNSIVPTDPQFAARAASLPAQEFRAPFYIDAATAANVPAAAATVPQMGLHWLDVRSPELQGMAGRPEQFQPFTKTFIYGSWDGQFIFDEPMITRDYIMAKRTTTDAAVRDEIIPLSVAGKRVAAGYYPKAYRITWDAEAKEYRIALTQLAWSN